MAKKKIIKKKKESHLGLIILVVLALLSIIPSYLLWKGVVFPYIEKRRKDVKVENEDYFKRREKEEMEKQARLDSLADAEKKVPLWKKGVRPDTVFEVSRDSLFLLNNVTVRKKMIPKKLVISLGVQMSDQRLRTELESREHQIVKSVVSYFKERPFPSIPVTTTQKAKFKKDLSQIINRSILGDFKVEKVYITFIKYDD
ncbi:MAG: hypothetical protein ACLFQK_01240 [Fibrobacterota bacterium]